MIDKKQIEKLIARYDAKANAAATNYQMTGLSRYRREQVNAEDLAESLRAAYTAADDHVALGDIRAQVIFYASKADQLLHSGPSDDKQMTRMTELLESLISYEAAVCRYQRMEAQHGSK